MKPVSKKTDGRRNNGKNLSLEDRVNGGRKRAENAKRDKKGAFIKNQK